MEQIVGIEKRAEPGVPIGWRREYNGRWSSQRCYESLLETAKDGWQRRQHLCVLIVYCDSIIRVS